MNTCLFNSQVPVRFPSCLLNSLYAKDLFCFEHLKRAELSLPWLRLQFAFGQNPGEKQSCKLRVAFLVTLRQNTVEQHFFPLKLVILVKLSFWTLKHKVKVTLICALPTKSHIIHKTSPPPTKKASNHMFIQPTGMRSLSTSPQFAHFTWCFITLAWQKKKKKAYLYTRKWLVLYRKSIIFSCC